MIAQLNILFLFLFSVLIHPSLEKNKLIGKWRYVSCTIKNTSMDGTLEFKNDSVFILNAKAQDDTPAPDINGVYHYKLNGNEIVTDKSVYGMSKYFLVEKNKLYLSDYQMSKEESDWSKGYLSANWLYKLERVK